jgi:hypothetical protein
MKARRSLAGGLMMLALLGLVSGCTTTCRTVDEHYMDHPASYSRVQILPFWFEGAGNIDRSFTTNDLQLLSRQTVSNLVADVQQLLGAKGYDVVGPDHVRRVDELSPKVAAELGPSLEFVRADLFDLLRRQYAASITEKPLAFMPRSDGTAFHHQAAACLTNVLARLCATNAKAVLLMDSKVFFESNRNRTKRAMWNWTGGGVTAVVEVGFNAAMYTAAMLARANTAPEPIWIDPFWHSNNSIQLNLVLVDVQTRTVLWLNQQDFKHQDPRNAQTMDETITDAMRDLPPTWR